MRRIAIVSNAQKPNVAQLAECIVDKLVSWGLEPILGECLADETDAKAQRLPVEEQLATSDAVVVLGGDGTILSVARTLARVGKEIPVLGVNLGQFGFLAEVTVPELQEALESLRDGDFKTSVRNILKTEILDGTEITFLAPALNEVVVSRRLQGRIAILTASIDGEWGTTYRADGLILSTTTGSTAHSMAAGGPILAPEMDAWLLTPICPHTLGVRALVIPGSSVVDIRSEQTDVELQITVDGQEQYSLPPGQALRLHKHPVRFVLITSKRRTFYEILRKKFNLGDTWAALPRFD